MQGRVARVHAKPRTPGEHGLPKQAVPEARVTLHGVEGDHNNWREAKKAGDPVYGLLLMTSEALAAIRADGWPVQPGDIGENLLIEGVPYDAMQPGTRWRAGEIEVEITKVCEPCSNLYALPYVGDAGGPAFLKAMLGRRGWYARVLRPGTVRPGDAFARA
ncbi:MAG TPA: MOSC domain-containing protein [Candidatus Thermoplasmatota archaeon]|jgi:MOSC domain-containing protein YiiM|nr:MOSC domain-containing protein [Candidatus Thermoplasmatota archaeon]